MILLFFSVKYNFIHTIPAMPKLKTRAVRLKDLARFHSYKAEDKYEDMIEPRKTLEEKGFLFPNNQRG